MCFILNIFVQFNQYKTIKFGFGHHCLANPNMRKCKRFKEGGGSISIKSKHILNICDFCLKIRSRSVSTLSSNKL
jgi:hypothetical protein